MATHEGSKRITLAREERFRFRVRFAGAPNAWVTDEAPPLGDGSGPSPSALLGAAVGNCLASSLLFCLEKSHIEVSDLEAEIEVETTRDERGRLRIPAIHVRLAPSVPPESRERMGRCLEVFESFCVVTESVRKGIAVDVAVDPRVLAHDVASAEGTATRA